MRNLLNILFILLFISSCSDTDNNTIPEIINEDDHAVEKVIPLDLEIEEIQKNIFDYAGSAYFLTNMVLCFFIRCL
jgi:PBP1b-binding outer membrane lipoprotein LpoB